MKVIKGGKDLTDAALIAVKKTVKGDGKGFAEQPSYLRRHSAITNTKSKHELSFNNTVISATGSNADVTEVGIEDGDLFIATAIGFFLTVTNTANKGANSRLFTYPNAVAFPNVTGAVSPNVNFQRADLNIVYNGKLSFAVAGTTHIERIQLADFLDIPETQQTADTNLDQFNLEASLMPLKQPIFLHGGNEQQRFIAELPQFDGNLMEHTTKGVTASHKMVLIVKGLLIKGAAGSNSESRGEVNRRIAAEIIKARDAA